MNDPDGVALMLIFGAGGIVALVCAAIIEVLRDRRKREWLKHLHTMQRVRRAHD